MSTPHGERMKRAYSLTSRERRSWVTRLMNKQAEVEAAEEALHKLMLEANEAGVSYDSIGGALAIHGSSAKTVIARYVAAKAGEGK